MFVYKTRDVKKVYKEQKPIYLFQKKPLLCFINKSLPFINTSIISVQLKQTMKVINYFGVYSEKEKTRALRLLIIYYNRLQIKHNKLKYKINESNSCKTKHLPWKLKISQF